MHDGFDVLEHVLLRAGLAIDAVKGKVAGILVAEADRLFRQRFEAAAISFFQGLWSEPSHHPSHKERSMSQQSSYPSQGRAVAATIAEANTVFYCHEAPPS